MWTSVVMYVGMLSYIHIIFTRTDVHLKSPAFGIPMRKVMLLIVIDY